eukprot:COSAG01_NODE_3670_length_5810_cov_30.694099_3_plen_458_part_00
MAPPLVLLLLAACCPAISGAPVCTNALAQLCGAARSASAGNCFVCAGMHQAELMSAGCTNPAIAAWCATEQGVMSCNTPLLVDCAAVGRRALAPELFGMKRECAGGVCGVEDCCAPPSCHDEPGWETCGEYGRYDCHYIAREGECSSETEVSCDGMKPSQACCACGGGSKESYLSCRTPHGGLPGAETPVDCAAVGRVPLQESIFGAVQDCEGGECGVEDCCAPVHCHDVPGWKTVLGNDDCSTSVSGYCNNTNPSGKSSAGLFPAQACCGCGGGSLELFPSCDTPSGRSWDEPPVDCAAAHRLKGAPPAGPGECKGDICDLDDCCRPADWAPACTGDELKAWAIRLTKHLPQPTGACTSCLNTHAMYPPPGLRTAHRFFAFAFCLPVPVRTACTGAETKLLDANQVTTGTDVFNVDTSKNSTFLGHLSGSCIACLVASPHPSQWKPRCTQSDGGGY